MSILLPGLDGTGEMFKPFVAAAPPGVALQSLPLPRGGLQTYPHLATWLIGQLPPDPVVLIAESFSGPLAILAAKDCPNVVALVLCASFVESPVPRAFAHLLPLLRSGPPAAALLRFFLTGGDRRLADAVRVAASGVQGKVIVERIAAVLRVDVTSELQNLRQSVLYLRATHDRLVSARSAVRIRRLRPSTRIVDVRAPHMLLQTCPAEAWRHILTFLEETASGAPANNVRQ